MKIEKEQFKDTECFKAEDKYRTAKHFYRFVKNGFQRKDFNKRIYEHLHLHCGFIAHYNINGFYQEYFNGSKTDLKRFAEHFLNFNAMPYEDVYNGANVNYEPYNDISKCFADILIEFDIKKQVEKMEIEIIDKKTTFIKKCFVIELELNGKVFEISIQENYNTNSDFFDIDWDFLDFEDLEEYKKPTDEEIDFIDDWVRKYRYEKYGEDKK